MKSKREEWDTLKINFKKFIFAGETFYRTCVTKVFGPSSFTIKTSSVPNLTCVVYTVGGTRSVTVTAVETGITS